MAIEEGCVMRKSIPMWTKVVHILALVVLAVLAIVSVRTSDAQQIAGYSGYNSSGRLRLDILVLSRKSPGGEHFARLLASGKNSRDLFVPAFRQVVKGRARRAAGCIPVIVRMRGVRASRRDVFVSHHYANTNRPERPARSRQIQPTRGVFKLEACHGYASLDLPSSFLDSFTAVVSITVAGKTVSTFSGELQRFAGSGKQWAGFLVVK